MTHIFARHLNTGTWHIVCEPSARCTRKSQLDRASLCDAPPAGEKVCCACLDHARAHQYVPLKRLLNELEK